MRAYFVLGMRRSGNHCVIQSIIENYDRVTFYNDITHCLPNRRNYCCKDLMDASIRKKLVGPLIDHKQDTNSGPQAMIFSMEDLTLEEYHLWADRMSKQYNITESYFVIVSRDLLNMLASRIFSKREVTPDTWQIWLTHVNASNRYIGVYYNRFLIDSSYRASLASSLGLGELKVPDTVPQFGKGSSFKVGSKEPQAVDDYLTRYLEKGILDQIIKLQVPMMHIHHSQMLFDIQYQMTPDQQVALSPSV